VLLAVVILWMVAVGSDWFSLQDWTLISVLFYIAVLTLTTAYVYFYKRCNLFEPVSLYLFFVSLFTLPLPIRFCITTEIEGNVSPMLMQFAPWLAVSVVLTALALPTFVMAYYSRWAKMLGHNVSLISDNRSQGTGVSIWVLTAISVVLIYLLTESLGGILAFLLLGYKSSEETFGRGYLAVGFPWLVVAMLAWLDRFASRRKILDLIWFVGLMFINVAIFAITGNRAMLMYMAIALIVFVNFRIRRITLRTLIPVALFGFIVLNLMGTLRASSYENVGEFIEKTFISSEDIGARDKESLFYTLTIGEFVVPFETLPQLVRKIGVEEAPWFGLSFLRAPMYLIPSFIYGDRPDSIGKWYMNEYYGGSAGLNEGRQFFFLSEGYLNFGPFGILIVAGVWGLFWGGLHHWMTRGVNRFGVVLLYSLLSAFMFRCIAGDIVTLLVGTAQQSLAAVFIILSIAKLVRRFSAFRFNLFGVRRIES
jgi:hypothetical protein